MLRIIDSTGIIDVLRRPFRTILDILYIRCLGSGVAGTDENHSTYARWAGGVMSGEGNTLLRSLLGIWNTTRTWAMRRPKSQQSVIVSTNKLKLTNLYYFRQ
jgi:hypothetical protein